jgi:hypothetical protein
LLNKAALVEQYYLVIHADASSGNEGILEIVCNFIILTKIAAKYRMSQRQLLFVQVVVILSTDKACMPFVGGEHIRLAFRIAAIVPKHFLGRSA